MSNVEIYLRYKTKEAEKGRRPLKASEKNKLINDFFIRFAEYCNSTGLNILEVFEDFSTIVEIDELITEKQIIFDKEERFKKLFK